MNRHLPALLVVLCTLCGTEALARYSPKQLLASASTDGLSLTARAGEDRYAGYLEERAPRFANAALLTRVRLAQTTPPSADATRPDRAALEAEYKQLDDNVPAIGGPIALVVTGGVASIIGFYVFVFGAVLQSVPAVVIGLIVLAGGIALGVTGGILLGRRIFQRVQRTRRMNEIEEQLRGSPNESRPPMMVQGLGHQVVVARF